MSSTNFGSILIFASCVVGTCSIHVGEFFHHWRGHTVLLKKQTHIYTSIYILFIHFMFTHIYFPASGQAVVTGVVPSSPRFLPSFFVAQRAQQSHCSSMFHRV